MDFSSLSPLMKPIDVSGHPEFDGHELVLKINDPHCGLRAFIAVHRFFWNYDFKRPSALGGTRICDYKTEDDALTDVLRLSRGMTYKAAWAHTGFGGGKAVIMKKPEDRDAPTSQAMENTLTTYARYLNLLDGRFVTGEDVNFFERYATFLRPHTRWIAGGSIASGGGGDPSPYTARGVYLGIKKCLAHLYGEATTVKGVRVAIQGVGSVGLNLAQLLQVDGARLVIADKKDEQVARAKRALGDVSVVPHEEIHAVEAAVFAPCAMGAVLNEHTIPDLACTIVAGAANNQLATPEDGVRLHRRGILYAPDFVINAAGLMRVAQEFASRRWDESIERQVQRIPENLSRIFKASEKSHQPTSAVADNLAKEIIVKKMAERALRST